MEMLFRVENNLFLKKRDKSTIPRKYARPEGIPAAQLILHKIMFHQIYFLQRYKCILPIMIFCYIHLLETEQ